MRFLPRVESLDSRISLSDITVGIQKNMPSSAPVLFPAPDWEGDGEGGDWSTPDEPQNPPVPQGPQGNLD